MGAGWSGRVGAGGGVIVVIVEQYLRYAGPMSKSPTAKPLTKDRLERSALRYLERFGATAQSLRRVLMRKVVRAGAETGADVAEGAHLVEVLISRYLECGLLDDRLFAEGRGRSLLRRGQPVRAIRQTLSRKGVADEDIDAALETVTADLADTDADWAAAVAYARRRRIGPFRPAEDRAAMREKDMARLGRAGFSWEMARRLVEADATALDFVRGLGYY